MTFLKCCEWWSVPSLSTWTPVRLQGCLPPLWVTGTAAAGGSTHSFAAAQVISGHRGSRLRNPCRQLSSPSSLLAGTGRPGLPLLPITAAPCDLLPHTSLSLMCFTFLTSSELCWEAAHPPLNETLSFLQRKGILLLQ